MGKTSKLLAILIGVLVLVLPVNAQNAQTQVSTIFSATCPATPTGPGCAQMNVTNFGSAAIQITGTWSGTITFEGSVDGITYQALNATASNGSSTITTTTTNGVWTMAVGGLKSVQVRFSSYTSGAAVVSVQTAVSGGSSGGGGSGGGSVTVNDPVVTSQKALVNGSGQLAVNCANCSGSGVSQQDNTGFTPGTTNFVPSGAEVDDVATTAVTENNAGSLRMSTRRELYGQLRDAAGNERGANVTAANALKVDGSAVTQPVSGTVTATGTITANLGTLNGAALDASVTGLQVAQGSTTSGQKGEVVQGAVTTNAPTYTTAQTSPVSLDTSGNTRVSLKDTPSNTNNLNVNLAASAATVTVSGTVTANAGTNLNTSALSTSSNQTNGTQKSQIVDGSGNVIASTSNNLNVQCANCSGTGASATDEATMTQGVSVFAPTGGFFNNAITNLTSGQQGMVALTASRSFHVSFYDASGNALLGSKTSANSVPVVIASDQGAFPVSQSGTWTVQPGNTANTTAWLVAGGKTNNNAAPGATNVGALGFLANAAGPSWTEGNLVLGSVDLHGTQRVGLYDSTGAVLTPSVDYTHNTALTPATTAGPMIMGRASAAAPTNVGADDSAVMAWLLRSGAAVSQPSFAGVLATTGNGVSGTGVQRVTMASDSTGQTKITDGTNTAVVTATAGGSLQVSCSSGCSGSGGTSIADEAAFTQGTTSITPLGGLFKTSYTALTSGQAGVAQMTSNGGLYTNLDKVQGTNVDVNSGNKSAGTIRVTLATDQVQLTNALKVDGSAVTQPVSQATASSLNAQVQGAGASGASKAGNPVQIGGVFNTTQPTVTTGQTVEAQATARGAAIVATGTDTFNVTVNAALPAGGNTIGSLAANQSTNMAQVAGTAADVNSGNKSAGTLRVVLATDQPQLTNKLLVTPDANSAVNVAQFGGSAVVTGTGVGGAGIPRVTLSNDSTLAANQSTNVAQVGGTATDTNSGNKSAGTIRMVLATDQPALTNALKVDINAVSTSSNLNTVMAVGGSTTTSGGGNLQNAATANGNGSAAAVAGYASVVLTVNCASCSGGTTVNFEGSADSGSNYGAVWANTLGTNTLATTTTTAGVTQWYVTVAGLTNLRARISAYSAGTVTVSMTETPVGTHPQVVNANVVSVPSNQTANITQFGGNNIATGTGAAGNGVPRVTISNDSTLAANQSVNVAQMNGVTTSMNTGSSDTGTQRVVLADGLTECTIVSAASTNSTSCKGSAGNFFGYDLYNTTTTVYYLRLYNSASAPTCSSATGFIRSIPIPPASAAGQVGGAIRVAPIGVSYGTGIGYCITGGSSSTDNTNAAVGVFGTVMYR